MKMKNALLTSLVLFLLLYACYEDLVYSISGTWRLKYKSLEGTGSITLHLNIINQTLN